MKREATGGGAMFLGALGIGRIAVVILGRSLLAPYTWKEPRSYHGML